MNLERIQRRRFVDGGIDAIEWRWSEAGDNPEGGTDFGKGEHKPSSFVAESVFDYLILQRTVTSDPKREVSASEKTYHT